ncbi:MAG: vitamin K epoxide reductase family protein [bacterium]|nr:vitamin K epoxide reductase family protein [bacterium]
MTALALLFTLAAIGISETAYLIQKRKETKRPVCVIGEDCVKVLSSKYNHIFVFIHNDTAGFLFYIFISCITAFLVIGIPPIAFWILVAKIAIFAGVGLSCFFIFLQWKIIRAWCFWCLMSSFTIFAMAFIVLINDLII